MRKTNQQAFDGLPPKSCHLMIDIWTSRQNEPVLGIKVQFIENWEMKQMTLGFQYFPEAHTGENVKKIMEEFMVKLNFSLSKVVHTFLLKF